MVDSIDNHVRQINVTMACNYVRSILYHSLQSLVIYYMHKHHNTVTFCPYYIFLERATSCVRVKVLKYNNNFEIIHLTTGTIINTILIFSNIEKSLCYD